MIEEFPRNPANGLDEIETASGGANHNPLIDSAAPTQYRGSASDSLFGFMIAAALSIGLAPLLPDISDLRYTLAWSALAGTSILSWLLGNMERVGQEKPENIGWALLYGLMLGIPCMVFFRQAILVPFTAQVFPGMTTGSLFAYLVFVMPIAETLYFRGLLQKQLPLWLLCLLATFWNAVLFFPVMWQKATEFTGVTAIIVIILLLMNILYVYVRERNGLAAAWVCQIVANLVILYLPFLFL